MDIYFGLSDYKRLRYMIKMAKLLKYKKKQERILIKTSDSHLHLKYLKEIKKINLKAKQKLDSLKKYAEKHQ